MNVALQDCYDHLREAFADLRLAESQADVAAGKLAQKRDPEDKRLRGVAQGYRESTRRIADVLGLMERYLEQSRGADHAA